MRTSLPLGPRPARTDRPGTAALRVLQALADSAGPATIAELTAVLGGHPNSIRVQLDHLVEAGFVEVSLLPPQGRGRPSQTFRVTVDGRQVAGQSDDLNDHHALLEAVTDHLAGTDDPKGAALSVGRSWGRRLAEREGELPDLAGLLARQGFAPQPSGDGLRLLTCPLLDLVHRHPELVCLIHQGLIDTLSPRPAVLHPFSAPGACTLTLSGAPTA